ncbi:MAG TPA: radical SAM protein [Elusimicrobiales bacterium]|nr:radical SAM protein [Elusimicrobiales bacterium]
MHIRSAAQPAADPYEGILAGLSGAAAAPARGETIALIIPPSPQIPTPGREFLISGPFEGFTAVATLVKKLGYKLKVVDCRPEGADRPERLLAETADAAAVGVAAYCDSFVFLGMVTKLLKQDVPERLVFLGGPLVSSLPEYILGATSADCAILGEAELTLIEFLETAIERGQRDFSAVKGMAYRAEGAVRLSPPRPQIADLDNLPFPDYTVWPDHREIVKAGQIIISTSRGCPCACSFCYKTIPGLRMKSLARFDAEVAHLKATTGFNYTWLNDLTFNADADRAMRVADILSKHGVRYHCFARVTGVTERFAGKLKATGCQGIWFGIESYDQRVLELNRKNTTIAQIDSALKISAAAGLEARGLFIVGLPGETEASLKGMLEFIRGGEFIPLVKYLVPFPGTALYAGAAASGRIPDAGRFLEELSARRAGDYDDKIVNLTDLDEGLLREHFHKIWDLTRRKTPG